VEELLLWLVPVRRGHRDGANNFEREWGESNELGESFLARGRLLSRRARTNIFLGNAAQEAKRTSRASVP